MTGKGSFTRMKKGKMKLIIRDEYKDDLLRLEIGDIDGFLKKRQVRIIDDVDKSVVVSFPLERPGGRERIAVKRYDRPALKRKLKDIFRISKAVREWKVGNWLWERGVPVALPLAVGERRRWRILKDSFLISRAIKEAHQLGQYILTLHPPLAAEARRKKREVITLLAKELRDIHDKGFFHGDLNASHIMVKVGAGKRPAFYFVDFESSKVGRKVYSRQWVKELARLNESMPSFISRTDKVRFFQVYSERLKLDKKERKKIIAMIETRTRAKKGAGKS